MRNVVALVTLEDGKITDSAAELAEAARRVAGSEDRLCALLLGNELEIAGSELSHLFEDVRLVDDERLADPDGDLYSEVAGPVVAGMNPSIVLMSHTNFAMDMAPRLSVLLRQPLITDCISVEASDDTLTAVRSEYSGKVQTELRVSMAEGGCVLTVRPGAYETAERSEVAGEIRRESMPEDISVRRRYVRTIAGGAGDVDLSAADVLVAVGRGIDDGDNMEIIEDLAGALGAEIACSRPVVDNGWLPKTRQVGTSGATVRPRVYLAVGISGSFQHMGGVKGNPFIVAINTDPRAPIFGDADVGIVGDLFDIVPLLTERIRAARS